MYIVYLPNTYRLYIYIGLGVQIEYIYSDTYYFSLLFPDDFNSIGIYKDFEKKYSHHCALIVTHVKVRTTSKK